MTKQYSKFFTVACYPIVMDSEALPLPRRRQLPSIGFGPYLLLEAVPWLLLATVMRMVARSMGDGFGLLVLAAGQFALFIAFLLASQKMIHLAGGTTGLVGLSFRSQAALARAVLWRLLVLFLAANLLALWIGVDRFAAAVFWLGFDGIAFKWLGGTLLMTWSAVVAAVVYLMVVEKGAARQPGFVAVLRQFLVRWRYLLSAAVAIIAMQAAANAIQSLVGAMLQPLHAQLAPPLLKASAYLMFSFIFAYVRLWATIAILTYALRASYRRQPS